MLGNSKNGNSLLTNQQSGHIIRIVVEKSISLVEKINN